MLRIILFTLKKGVAKLSNIVNNHMAPLGPKSECSHTNADISASYLILLIDIHAEYHTFLHLHSVDMLSVIILNAVVPLGPKTECSCTNADCHSC
jgi:hypothetical protein